jgi:hypothetical protein
MSQTLHGRFVKDVQGEMISFPDQQNKKSVKVLISHGLLEDFEVQSKDLPSGTHTAPDGSPIVWINNIGLAPKGSKVDVNEHYEIHIPRRHVNKKNPKVYLYIDGVQELDSADYDVNHENGGTIAIRLRHLDPGIGIGGY